MRLLARFVAHAGAVSGSLLVLAAPAAGAQGGDPLARLDPTSRTQIERILDSAHAAQLPVGPIRARTIEGLNKHVDGPRVVEVARSILASLRDARAVLGPADDEELIIAAGVVGQQLRPDHLARRNATAGHSVVLAFSILGDLVRLGVPHPQARAAIARLWRAGASDDEMYALWSSVTSDVSGGTRPADGLRKRMIEREGHRSRGAPRSD